MTAQQPFRPSTSRVDPIPSAGRHVGPKQRIAVVILAIAIVAIAFVYRFNTLAGPLAGFDNDHFPALTRAVAMLDGERPLRDFADSELRGLWPSLTYSTSALAQRVLGRSLRSEALLSTGLLAIGAGALFLAAAALSNRLVAAWASLLAIGLSPALYNHPKITPYALAILAMLAYAYRPSTARLGILASSILLGALFRHDHGVTLGLTAGALLLLLDRGLAVRRAISLMAWLFAGLLPGIVIAQMNGGIISYLKAGVILTRQEAARTIAAPPSFRIDWSQPLVVTPDPQPPPARRVSVRWIPALTPDRRAAAESELGLKDRVSRGDELNWSYAPSDTAPERLRAIVSDPRVADTDGIDRARFTLEAEPMPDEAPNRSFWRWRILPGILTADNAVPWLYATGWLIVIGAMICLIVPPWRRAMTDAQAPAAIIGSVCLLGVLVVGAFLRNSASFRLADASVPIAALGAWLMARGPRVLPAHATAARAGLRILLAIIGILTTLSVGAVGDVRAQAVSTGILDGMSGTSRQWTQVWSTLGGLPDGTEGIEPELARAVKYLRRCTKPDDRILIDSYRAELFYFAERGFAAGQNTFFSNFYTSDAQQRLALERWRGQKVPLALLEPEPIFSDAFAKDYPILAAHLSETYKRSGRLEVRRGIVADVWADRRRAGTTDEETGLPCFGT